MSETSPLVTAQQTYSDAVPFQSLEGETCLLTDALNRTTHQDIKAPEDMPPFNRAIVEGFLVHATATEGASDDNPISFSITGEVKPGDEQCPSITGNEAIRVSTGSILPDGDYAIVRMWEAKFDGEGFSISRPFPPRFFIENKGCDLIEGITAIAAGTVLGPLEIGTIAALGVDEVTVTRKPRVTIFASGDEVVPYINTLKPGQIRDSNSIMLANAVIEAGGIPTTAGIMSDDFDKFVSAVKDALNTSDMIVISGGTAIGDRDFISDLFKETGELLIDGVKMKSGRPLIMGIANGKPLIGVAGHPPEALRGFHLFGTAAMNRIQGIEAAMPEDNVPAPMQ